MFSSWTVALEHYPFLHQILLLTPLKHLKQDRTFCYEEVLPLWQKALQYLKGINWNNFRMCNVFWICVRELNHCFNGYFLELLDVRQAGVAARFGLQRKSDGQAPAGSVLAGLNLQEQWTGSLCTYAARSVRAHRIPREKAIWLIRNFSPQESWKHLIQSYWQGEFWQWTPQDFRLNPDSEHAVTSDTHKACMFSIILIQKNLPLRVENSLSALTCEQ